MLFNSYEFIFFFLPLSLLVYLALRKYGSRRVSLSWIVAASLFFYGWWNPAYLGLILASMFFNYSIGTLLSSNRSHNSRKTILVIGITANLLLLGYYKYANFFVDTINEVFGYSWNFEHIILPLAISFFTFQQITYLVDAYRAETREYNFLHYALFVSFFPQLIAGPIVHHREMMPQFVMLEKKIFNFENIAVGLSIFFLGLFKKVVVADSLSPYAISAFDVVAGGGVLSFFEAWLGVLAYTFQLYFDFSGYSDMAVGIAFLFGIRLPLNFNSPYKSGSIIEFWQRWHMTLSRFLRDYLYIPLGGNRKGLPRRYINLMLTMLLGGLWHGAGWTFVVWGGLHGIYLVINHGWRSIKEVLGIRQTGSAIARMLSQSLTFFSVALAWVYFRADSLDAANLMVKSLFGYGGVIWPEEAKGQLGAFADILPSLGVQFQFQEHFNGLDHILLVVSLLLVVWLAPNIHQVFYKNTAVIDPPQPVRLSWRPDFKWATAITVIAVVSLLKLGQVSEFLYFQF
jgi:D-alanyl-lipoteichoic acid acyltransferase DltB (MBOAT superfamily)